MSAPDWLTSLNRVERLGDICQVSGLHVIANGPPQVFVGEMCEILNQQKQVVMLAEIIGFKQGEVYLMPLSNHPLKMGDVVRATGKPLAIPKGEALLGHLVDAKGEILTPSQHTTAHTHINANQNPIHPLSRANIDKKLHTGYAAIDTLLPIGYGQRIGIFAGSGVGKSTLLAGLATHMACDIQIFAFVGERGREVQEFYLTKLDKTTRDKSIIVAACSDDSALMRRQAVYTATALAQYFCNQGKQVGLFIDSMTRFAMAQREIGLSLGEVPTARGYTPSCFAKLPGLIEQAGAFKHGGSITGIYSILVEGDDFNEPIADHMRALLDGHIVLNRDFAQRGLWPAFDILKSISRLQSTLLNKDEQALCQKVWRLLSIYQQNQELIHLGAWQPGKNKALDEAIDKHEALEAFIHQPPKTDESFWSILKSIIS